MVAMMEPWQAGSGVDDQERSTTPVTRGASDHEEVLGPSVRRTRDAFALEKAGSPKVPIQR
jgi:hypothetical protein